MKKKLRINQFVSIVMLFVLGSTLGCAHGNRIKIRNEKYSIEEVKFISASEIKEHEGGIENYFIEIGDVLEVSVWQVEQLKKETVVRPDGKISFPLIGDIPAYGKTIEELRRNIADKMRLYIKMPQVNVSIVEFGGKKAVILGEIWSPGVIKFSSPTRVIEAVGLAGDFNDDANKDRIFIIRNLYEHEPTIITVDVNSILREANLKENILVRSGDIIYIPRAFIADFKYFMDKVFGPVIRYAEVYYGDTWRRRREGEWRHRVERAYTTNE